ncbi:MAG: acyl-CoA dehydrogenase, partial [Betaproteobacteria bacterium]|nr:acyl-CoA dehydrogenase [Betaproteobacteria bacterium]
QYLVYVRYGPGVGGIGSVMIRRGAKGFTVAKPSKFMSDNEWAPLYFDNVYVPPEDVLLPAGGFKKQISGFNAERIGNASRSLAYGRYCYNLAREYVMTRKQFGRPLCEFQGLQWKFAEMKVQLDAAQLLLYRAATNADRGFPAADETTIAKLFCNKAGFDICNESMQCMGGLGYTRETLVEYCFRRSRGWMIRSARRKRPDEGIGNKVAGICCVRADRGSMGPGISEQAAENDPAISGWRSNRHSGSRHGPGAQRSAGTKRRYRQPPRRGWDDRRNAGGALSR